MDQDKTPHLAPTEHQQTSIFDDRNHRYWRDLVNYTRETRDDIPLGEFRKLQVMNIVHLFNRLSSIKSEVEHCRAANVQLISDLRETLHYYAEAIRDYKEMSALGDLPDYATETRLSLDDEFPYLATPYDGEENRPYDTRYKTLRRKTTQLRDPVCEVLRKVLPNRLSWPEEERKRKRPEYGAGKPPETYSKLVDSAARFIIGTLGGCTLIVPMVVMARHPSLTKSLIVVSVSLVLFALIVGLVFELDNKDTIVATATYAAVLVVFVGQSGDGNALTVSGVT